MTMEYVQSEDKLLTSYSLLEHCGWGIQDCQASIFFQSVPEDYGHEEEGAAPSEDDEGGIEVPPLRIELTNDQISKLQTNVDPLENSDDYGISLYLRTLQILHSWETNDEA